MEPLSLLEKGAERIRNNDLSKEISYVGDAEFEDVCITFNHMQEHILREQKKTENMKRQEQIQAETGNVHLEISIDPEQMQRIFDNLVENSRKYAERELLKMKLLLRRTPDGVEIGFLDNGVGVPEEKILYVFDEFYRGDESRNKKEGNGLGLYIVKYLVEDSDSQDRIGR